MRHDDHRHAVLCELTHQVEHLADHLRVERRGGLVKEHDLRLHRERAHNSDTLLLAAGEHGRIGIGLVGKVDALKKLHRKLVGFLLSLELQRDRGEGDVLLDGHVREEVEVLENHAHLAAVQVEIDLGVGNIHAAKYDLAGGRSLQQVQAAQQRRLARPGGADYRDDLAARNAETAVIERLDRSADVFLFDMLYADELTACRHGASSSLPLR